LPVTPLTERIEFPVGYGKQTLWFGRPISPQELASMAYGERKALVIDAINGLGPLNADETPCAPDPDFEASVKAWAEQTGVSESDAVLLRILQESAEMVPDVSRLVEASRSGTLEVAETPRDQWLGVLARRLFGPNGPKVVDGS